MSKSASAVWRPHLGTSGARESVKFCCALFGWTFRVHGRGGSTLSLLRDSQEIATCVPPVTGFDGTTGGCYPAFWVDDLAEHSARASSLGAKIVAREGGGDSRSVIVIAPTGEVCALLDGSGAGAPRTGPEDAWLEVVTPDPGKTSHFYEGLLGWDYMPHGSRYGLLTRLGKSIAALGELHEDWDDRAFLSATGRTDAAERAIPPHWMVYFRVRALDEALARVEFLGGTVMARHELRPDLAPAALIQDPTGNFWSIVGS